MNTLLVLGSNSDMGQAIAYKFAEEGFNIILAARNINDYQKRLASDLSIRNEVKVTNIKFDGVNYETHKSFLEQLNPFPNVIVSVFGYLGNQELAVESFDESHQIINANYVGHVSLLNSCSQLMKAKSIEGTIIGISSVAGERGRQSNYIYGSAKSGFTTYLDGLRNDMYKHNIHVLNVKPGFVKTKMIDGIETPEKLTASPKQIASKTFKAYKKKKNTIYVLPIWRLIMFVIRNIPEFIFKKLKL